MSRIDIAGQPNSVHPSQLQMLMQQYELPIPPCVKVAMSFLGYTGEKERAIAASTESFGLEVSYAPDLLTIEEEQVRRVALGVLKKYMVKGAKCL